MGSSFADNGHLSSGSCCSQNFSLVQVWCEVEVEIFSVDSHVGNFQYIFPRKNLLAMRPVCHNMTICATVLFIYEAGFT